MRLRREARSVRPLTDEGGSDAETIVRLAAGDPQRDALATGKLVLMVGGEAVRFELTVPAGPVAVEDVLPVVQGLSSLFADRAAAKTRASGRTVSCRAGCGACCRQLVPISAAEARAIARLVEALPAPRQAEVRRRFAEAQARLDAAGLLDRLSDPEESRRDLGIDYFRLGIACLFLDNESCSIHPDRPLSCREYLVVSPAENCRSPTAEGIEQLAFEGRPSLALLKADPRDGWLPLALALTFDEHAPPSSRDRSGADILGDVIGGLA